MSFKKVKAEGKAQFSETPGYPSDARIKKGMVALIECEQEIPCNPCETSCPQNAIKIGIPITNIPELDGDACVGCGLCIAGCPGLAIFMVDMTFSETTALAVIPYEYLPQLEKDDRVTVKNRDGEPIGTGVIHKAVYNTKTDKTTVLYIEVDKSIAEEVRAVGQ